MIETYLQMQIPKDHRVLKQIPDAVFSALRGPDMRWEDSFVAKGLGAALVRSYIMTYTYGDNKPLEALRQWFINQWGTVYAPYPGVKIKLTTQLAVEQLSNSSRHYASHMNMAFKSLRELIMEIRGIEVDRWEVESSVSRKQDLEAWLLFLLEQLWMEVAIEGVAITRDRKSVIETYLIRFAFALVWCLS